MKLLAITIETMARVALFTAVSAMSIRYMMQRRKAKSVAATSSKEQQV